jgi:hypothetical protein
VKVVVTTEDGFRQVAGDLGESIDELRWEFQAKQWHPGERYYGRQPVLFRVTPEPISSCRLHTSADTPVG